MISGFPGQSSTKWPEPDPGRCSAACSAANRKINRNLVERIESSQVEVLYRLDSRTLSGDLGNAYNARPVGEPFI
jgi:hypothetical protein